MVVGVSCWKKDEEGQPKRITGIILLFVSLFASLARTWYLALPVRPR